MQGVGRGKHSQGTFGGGEKVTHWGGEGEGKPEGIKSFSRAKQRKDSLWQKENVGKGERGLENKTCARCRVTKKAGVQAEAWESGHY